MVVNKEVCWRALQLTFWFNDHSEFFFEHIHGDKETFHLAWRKLEQPYTMVSTPIESLDGIMCQHDLDGRRLFQHRNTHKWRLFEENTRVAGFLDEDVCLGFLDELERRWDGKIHVRIANPIKENGFVLRGGTCDPSVFRDVYENNEYELPDRLDRTGVVIDVGAHIGSFSYACASRGARRIIAFEPERENFRLAQHNLARFGDAVRLHQKAVWRSDRGSGPAVLLYSGYPQGDGPVNTGGGTVLVQAEDSPRHRRKELIATVGLDRVLRRYKSIRLLKLDCEGSEWPILFTAKLLDRVQALCGEYHELEVIPTAAQVGEFKRYTKKELEEFLKTRYRKVRFRADDGSHLGHFWAEDPIPG
jgi:FkbM family methyltransferase